MKRPCLTALALCLCALCQAQTPQPQPGTIGGITTAPAAPGTAPAPGTGTAAQPPAVQTPAAGQPPAGQDLVTGTMASDISTASYYELVSWCRELALDDAGSRKDLQGKLYAYFKVSPPAEKGKPSKIITVQAAKESSYFTVEEMNQSYVVLRGNVIVDFTDPEGGDVQKIEAQRLVYNQDLNTVTATGSVVYKITRSGKTDTFKGDALTFNVDTGEGVFYNGSTVRPLPRNGQDVNFMFEGDTISRLDNDTVVLQDGGFTSCDITPGPHYIVKANRMWILAPGEWALENAVLSVGWIPMFYLPVFFYPGDELFFHPSMSYDTRKGEVLQTTTYLIGRKPPDQNSSFSFMQMGSGEEADYDLELHGLFLRKVAPTKTPSKAPSSTLKVELDGYSRLGLFAGIVGDFPPLAMFNIGVARSRSLFPAGTGYTVDYLQPDGSVINFWNSSSVFGLMIPLRFGMLGKLNKSGDVGSISSNIEYYSDPFFTQDFGSRSEGMQFSTNLETLLAPSAQTNIQSNLSWDVNSKLDFSRLLKLPSPLALSMPYLNVKFAWQSKSATYDASVPTAVSAVDPARLFYYPSSLVAPNVSLSFSGDIFRYNSSQPAKNPAQTQAAGQAGAGQAGTQGQKPAAGSGSPGAKPDSGSQAPAAAQTGGGTGAGGPAQTATTPTPAAKDPGKGFISPIPPAASQTPAAAGTTVDHFQFRTPARKSDTPPGPARQEVIASVTYQVQPRAVLEQTFDSSAWLNQSDVDFKLLYGTFETGGSSQIAGNLSLFDRLSVSSITLTADGAYKTRYSPSDSLSAASWQALQLGDFNQDRFTLKSSFLTQVNPLLTVLPLAGTSLSYKLSFRLYQLSSITTDPLNPLFDNLGPAWDTTGIYEHTAQATLSLKAFDKADTLSFTAQLPPLNQTYSGRLEFWLWSLKTYAQAGAALVSDVWQYQPLIMGETWQLNKDVSASEELQMDLATGLLTRSTSQLKLWGFSGSYTAESLIPVDPLGNALGTEKAFRSSQFRVAYDYKADALTFWKNRIRLDMNLHTSWYMNLMKYTDNAFDFALSFNLSIYKFLDLSFSSVSNNTATYRYIPGLAEASPLNGTYVGVITDLLQSFNFFNIEDRYRSAFKLRSLSVKAVTHLHDWDVTFEYIGTPQLVNVAGKNQFQWTTAFSINVQWLAVPEVKGSIRKDTADTVYLRN